MSFPKIRVGDLCNLINGKAFKPEDWSEQGHPIIRIQNLNDASKPFNYWNGTLDRQVPVEPDDVLLAWSGTPGTSFGAHIWKGPRGILNQHIFRVDLDDRRITKEWFVLSVNFRLNHLIALAHGGVGLKHVTRGMVDDLEIPLPPISEQQRLTAVIGQADGIRWSRQRSIELLDALPHAIFYETFGDPAMNPFGFDKASLGDIIDFIGGSQPPKSTFLYEDGPDRVRFVQIRDFRTDQYKTYVPTKLAKRPFSVHDVMIGRYGPPVFQIFRGLSGTYNVALMKAEPKKGVLSDFVFYLLQERRLHSYVVANSERTAGQSGVNLRLLEGYSAFRPPLSLQRRFSEKITGVLSLLDQQKSQLSMLDRLFASLQHGAFNGELTSKHAQRELEMVG